MKNVKNTISWGKVLNSLKDTTEAFDDFKNKQKEWMNKCSWYLKVYIFWNFIKHLMHWDKTQILKRISTYKINGPKNTLFFFRELQLITVLLFIFIFYFLHFICNFYTNWSTRFITLKLCVAFSVFNFVLFLLKFISLFNKKRRLFDFKTS